jgi:phage terminase small subunit
MVTGYNTVCHLGTCPWTGDQFVRRYWVPLSGGYVYVDDSNHGKNSGTLGRQPTYKDGSTWRSDPEHLMALVKREWRRSLRGLRITP